MLIVIAEGVRKGAIVTRENHHENSFSEQKRVFQMDGIGGYAGYPPQENLLCAGRTCRASRALGRISS